MCLKDLRIFSGDFKQYLTKNCIALAPAFPHNPVMLARVLSAAVNGIEAFPVEVEVNCGWGDTVIVIIKSISPMQNPNFLSLENLAISISLEWRLALLDLHESMN